MPASRCAGGPRVSEDSRESRLLSPAAGVGGRSAPTKSAASMRAGEPPWPSLLNTYAVKLLPLPVSILKLQESVFSLFSTASLKDALVFCSWLRER